MATVTKAILFIKFAYYLWCGTVNIFKHFKQLNIFKRNKAPFELKVLSADSAREKQQNYSHSQNKKPQKQA
ncbi:MAG: hypothetical protein ACPL1B_11005, partial [Thermoprotei archaeon]